MEGIRPLSMVRFKHIKPPHSLWEELFGQYPWFYAPFIGDFLSKNGLRMSDVYFKYNDFIYGSVPEKWHTDFRWGQWDALSQVQFRSTLSQDLVRLDKAIMSVALVRSAYLYEGANNILTTGNNFLDPADMNQIIIPSCFVVDGLERIIRNDELVSHIAEVSGQRRLVISELSRGFAVVEYIATDIVNACFKLGERMVDMRLLKDRRDGVKGKLVRPVASQQLSLDRIREFYSA